MGQASLSHARTRTTIFLSHVGAFLFVMLAAYWLRSLIIPADALLQGYLQVISSLLAFVFAAVTLVRFQGTQDRISLILGAGFFLCGAVLIATSVLFFQFLPETSLRLPSAPLAWWLAGSSWQSWWSPRSWSSTSCLVRGIRAGKLLARWWLPLRLPMD